tara:strand:+ start:213 stop:437 length:225 start_codon:yes stop_codon:yes gene_type:complete
MDLNFLLLGGYGAFVWPAFTFTFLVCFYLYKKTKQELKEQEKVFMNEFKQPRYIKIEANKSGDGIKEIHSGTLI